MNQTLRAILLVAAGLAAGGCAESRKPAAAGTPPAETPSGLPARLSELGIFSDLGSLAPAAGVMAYEVKHPLWSDGALKRRHARLPDGTAISVAEDGEFTFPAGALFAKTFEHPAPPEGRRPIETRILRKSAEGWEMGAYVWNAAGDDADLTDGDETEMPFALPGCDGNYVVPGRASCLQCHAQTGDVVAGFAAWQLEDRVLEDLRAQGRFADQSPSLPHRSIDGSGDTERAALGYLAGNCAHCHNGRTAELVAGGLDLRHHRARETLVGVRAERLRAGDALRRVEPGVPERSVLWKLFTHTWTPGSGTGARMPPIGNSLVDPAGSELLRAWIASLAPASPAAGTPRAGG